MKALRVEIWSDIACPWCWVGKRHLEAALARFVHPVEVVWRAFELDPSAPKKVESDVDYVGRLAAKYGASREHAKAMIDRMTSVGAGRGLDFRFDRARPSNTFDAHRLLHFAAKHGRQGELKERLFQAYMHEGQAIADHDVLERLAAEVGLDPDSIRAVLGSDAHAAEVRTEQRMAAQLGISGVPFFVVAERHAVAGAQPTEVLLQVLETAWAEIDPAIDGDDAPACDPEGCAV
jgi:predicted DsbA family dithiol-disulfide isomerase